MTNLPPDDPENVAGAPPPPLDPVARVCLNRTRGAVLNIMVGTGLLIVLSGLVVLFFGGKPRPRLPEWSGTLAFGLLFALVVVSYVTRRALSSRAVLRDPRTRGARFYLAHVLGALLGALAVPLGLVYALLAGSEPQELAPFWVAALALGFLSLPWGYALTDFDEPMAPPGGGGGAPAPGPASAPPERRRRRPRR